MASPTQTVMAEPLQNETLKVPVTNAAAVCPPPIPEDEVAKVATTKFGNLQSMLSKQIDLHVSKSNSTSKSSAFDDSRWKELAVKDESAGFANIMERQWDVMTEKHLSQLQTAELKHIRNMKASLQQQIAALQDSLKAFQQAEMEILMTSSS